MAETGNAQSDANTENKSPASAESESPADNGSGERDAPAPIGASSETSDSAAAAALLEKSAPVGAGEPVKVQTLDTTIVAELEEAAVQNMTIPVAPPVTPVSSGDCSPYLPSLTDPVAIQSAVSTTSSTGTVASALPSEMTVAAALSETIEPTPVDPNIHILPQEGSPTVIGSVSNTPTTATPSLETPAPIQAVSTVPEMLASVGSTPTGNHASGGLTRVEADGADGTNNDAWKKRETELLNAVSDLDKTKRQAASDAIKLKLKAKDDELELLRVRVRTLETELSAALARSGGGGSGARNHELVETIKQQHEELLSKARGMIFDKTKIVKNQELQIAALMAQVTSLKDVNSITKDLLEIRNSEIKHLEERMECMEGRFKAEKERHMLVLKRAEAGQSINNDLRVEYETQLKLFKELREKYDQRVQALVAENQRLSETSTEPVAST